MKWRHRPETIVDIETDTMFASGRDMNQWFGWYFKEMRGCLSHYTIRGYEIKIWKGEHLDGCSILDTT
jgi:hypothetical protein